MTYLSLTSTFPLFDVLDVRFLAAVGLAVLEHFLWFHHFTMVWYPFDEILAYFVLLVWLVPFFLFISLSTSQLSLPGSGVPGAPGSGAPGPRRYNLRSLLQMLQLNGGPPQTVRV